MIGRRRLLAAAALLAGLAAARPATACDELGFDSGPCRRWEVHGDVGMAAGSLGTRPSGMWGLGAEIGARSGPLFPRLEYAYGVLGDGDAGPGTLHRLGLALAVPVAGFGPRLPDHLIRVFVDAGAGAQLRDHRGGGRARGIDAAVGLGLLLDGPSTTSRRHLLNWLRVRVWFAPGEEPAGCAGGACPAAAERRGGRQVGVLVSWMMGAGVAP